MTNWETVDVPRGAYLGWGDRPGQHVTGKVIDYSENGGTNFAGDPCPAATIELTEAAASFNKQGERTDFPVGEMIQLNAGQVSLKRALRAADPSPGDLVKIELTNLAKTAPPRVSAPTNQLGQGDRRDQLLDLPPLHRHSSGHRQ